MKVAVILGAFSIGTRPLDFHFSNIWISPRGLTGTDLATVMLARELVKRDHQVSLFTVHAQPDNKPAVWEGVKLYNFDERFSVVDDSFDTIISINEPNVLIGMTSKPLRVCWQFLNDFSFAAPNFDDYVDQYLGVCDEHTAHVSKLSPNASKWGTVGLGCEPTWYEDKRVPGRVVWCSSADRGLHWLLSQWPAIKAAVPEASLKVFYHFNYGDIENIEPSTPGQHPHVIEMGQRIRYMRNAMERLKPFGVEHVGSISRLQMQHELSEASVFAFSCDTVAFSEGFSVSTLEAHASYTVPVITSQDCLGGIYKDSGCVMIQAPVKDHLQEFTDAVIRGLTDKQFADGVIQKCRAFAEQRSWGNVVKQIEDVIINHSKFKANHGQ